MLQRRHNPWGGVRSSRGDVARHLPAEPLSPCHPQLRGGTRLGPGGPSSPQRPDGDPLYSRHHQGQTWQCQTDGPRREGLAGDKQDAQMALSPQGSRPHSHHRDRSQPQAEAQAQDPRRRPSLGLGPWAAQRAHRGLGVVSFQRCPRPGAPAPTARSHPHFLHRRGRPSRTHMSGKRSKRSRTARLRGSHTRPPGECGPGTALLSAQAGASLGKASHPEEGIPMGRLPRREARRRPCLGCGVRASGTVQRTESRV